MNVSPQSAESGANSSSSYEEPFLSTANTAWTSRQEVGGGQGAGEKGRTELWHQKNAKSTTSWKIPEGPKVEKQRREMLTVWRNREWTGDDSFTCYLPMKVL